MYYKLQRAALIFINDEGQILLIHRKKQFKEYYVFPGGTVEYEETVEEAALREAKEETSFDIELGPLFFQTSERTNKEHFFFLVKSYSGTLKLGEPEISQQNEHNQYIFEWKSIQAMRSLQIVPAAIKKQFDSLQKLVESEVKLRKSNEKVNEIV